MAEDGHLLHDWTSRTPSLLHGRIVLSGRVDGTVVMFVMNDDFERTCDELFQGDQVTSSCGKVYRLGVPQAPAEQPPDVEIRQRDLAAYAAEAADRLGRRADPAEPTITITSAQSLPVATVVDDEVLGTGIDAGAGADPPRELGGRTEARIEEQAHEHLQDNNFTDLVAEFTDLNARVSELNTRFVNLQEGMFKYTWAIRGFVILTIGGIACAAGALLKLGNRRLGDCRI